ncbi:MAG: LPS-assembly protein LptD [Hyphomicrobiaceae bacterium]
MRKSRTPQEGCGTSRGLGWWRDAAGPASVFVCLLAFFAVAVPLFAASKANAQDPSILGTPSTKKSSFGKTNGSMFGKIDKHLDKAAPLNLQGDQLIYDTQGNRVIARGNVEIFYNDYILTADEVVYDQNASTLTAVGNVTLKEPQGNIVRADRYTLTDDFRDGFVQSLSIVSKDDTSITAEQATRREGNVTEFRNGRFTPCKSDGSTPPLWCLSAARIIHDKDAQTITYQDATFDIYGQPVLYLPYFQHPDPTVKRKSGFLTPGFGQSQTLGFMTEIPYYFALAPNYDFTFKPGYLSKQGIMWGGVWRHRLENGEYTVQFAGIDQNWRDLPVPDAPYTDNRQEYNGWRGTVETRGQFALSSWWKLGWDVTLESDDQFRRFYKFDNMLLTDRVNQVYLTGQSDRNYFSARLYHFGGLLLDDTPQSESYTHPIIDYNYVFADPVLGGELRVDSNLLSFTRVDGATLYNPVTHVADGYKNQDIQRLTTEMKWRRRLTDSLGITYTPFANLRGDIYQFNDFTDPESFQLNANGDPILYTGQLVSSDTTFRGIAAGGATVSYPWVANTAGASHIIEPIGQIVSRQDAVTQRRLPDEDARSLVFDDTNLFEVSKFSGYDRTEMGTRVNAGVQYTFQSNDGGYARFLAGQSYHLTGDNVYANPGFDDQGNLLYSAYSGLETDRSDYVLGAYIAPTDSFRLISQSRFDQSSLGLRRQSTGLNYSYGPLDITGVYSYAAADSLVEQQGSQQEVQSALNVQLTDRWSAGAGVRYDIDASQLLSDFISVKYADECFVLTATYSESYYNSDTIQDDRTLMLRFELKHLGEFNYASDTLDFAFGGTERTN